MGNRLFKRIAKVTAWRDTIPNSATSFVSKQLSPGQQLEITDLRIRFTVERSLTKPPNQADIYLYNMSAQTRADLETKPLTVQLDAGYDDVPRLVFLGDLHFGMSKQQPPDWETLLQLGDGDRAYNHARVNRSYKAGSTVRQVLRDAAASMGMVLPKNIEDDPAFDTKTLTGKTSFGPTRDVLTKILASYGYHWSIQNKKLQVLRDNEVSSVNPRPIDQDHGMIGTPEFGSPPKSGKPPHMRVKMLLYPELTPGDLVQVASLSKNGKFRIEKVRHVGDTHGDEWTTEIEIQPF